MKLWNSRDVTISNNDRMLNFLHNKRFITRFYHEFYNMKNFINPQSSVECRLLFAYSQLTVKIIINENQNHYNGSGKCEIKLTRKNVFCFNGNSINFQFSHIFSDISRLDKSPLLANGYNAPPTHLNHMPFMQMGHHGAPLMSPMPHLPRHEMKNQNMQGIDAITRRVGLYLLFLN